MTPRMLAVDPARPDPAVIAEAAAFIRRGMLVGYPTDTLYGVAVDPRNAAAISRLFQLKGRSQSAAIALIAGGLEQVNAAAVLTPDGARLAARWWPGPLTIVLDSTGLVAPDLLAGRRTVGIRIPDHAVAVALARAAGVCLTATSANRSGQPPATTAEAVVEAIPELDAVIDGGPTRGGAPSTIVDASSPVPTLIREGAIAWGRVLRSLE